MKKIESLGTFIGGGTPSTSQVKYWTGNIPWISSSDIFEEDIHNIIKTRFITDEAINVCATKLVPKGTILMVSRVGVGKFAVADEGLCTSQDFTNLVTAENEYFICYYFVSRTNLFVKLSQGTSIKGFTTKDLKLCKLFMPEKQEQNKIANFLTSIDKRIQTQNEIIRDYESLEKSLIQSVFSESNKFKNINDEKFPEWEKHILGNIGKTLNGLTGKTKDDFGEGKPFIQYKQIFDNSKIDLSKCGKVKISQGENQTKYQFGDIFFTTSSETSDEIGTASVLLDEIDEVYLNSFCFGYRVDQKILNPKFAQFLFRSEIFRKKIIPLAQGSTRYNISKSSFIKLEVKLPSIVEQERIAHFLSIFANKINVEKETLYELTKQKKFLLQQLFI